VNVETLVILAVVYAVLSAIGKAREQAARRRRAEEAGRERVRRDVPAYDTPPEPRGRSTQEEALRLEEWLRGLGYEVPTSEPPVGAAPLPVPSRRPPPASATRRPRGGPLGRPADRRLEPAEEVEEAESLEVEARVESLERLDVERAERPLVDRDDVAAVVAEQRRLEAAQRDRPLTKADHEAFDRRVRESAPPAPAARPREARRAMLRRALIASEVLGLPVGLRPPQP